MALSEEYKRKLDFYLKYFNTYITTEAVSSGYRGFITKERLTLDEAKTRSCEDYPIGREWGYPGEYLWLFATLTVPAECEGKSIVLNTDDGEGIVWVNGRIMGSFDWSHKYIHLTDSAVPGETYEVVLEVFAGYGKKGLDKDHATGPINERTVHNFEVKNNTQKSIKGIKLVIWHEELYQAYMDLNTLYELRAALPADSQRMTEVDKTLKAADKKALVDDHDKAGEQKLQKAVGRAVFRDESGGRPAPHGVTHGDVHQHGQQAQRGKEPLFQPWGLMVGEGVLLCGNALLRRAPEGSAVTGFFHGGNDFCACNAALHGHGVGQKIDRAGAYPRQRAHGLFHPGAAGGAAHACDVILLHQWQWWPQPWEPQL